MLQHQNEWNQPAGKTGIPEELQPNVDLKECIYYIKSNCLDTSCSFVGYNKNKILYFVRVLCFNLRYQICASKQMAYAAFRCPERYAYRFTFVSFVGAF
jgi:hypothetical protein